MSNLHSWTAKVIPRCILQKFVMHNCYNYEYSLSIELQIEVAKCLK